MGVIKYIHIKSSITKISDLVALPSFKGSGVTIGEFVGTSDALIGGVTNLERIYSRYSSVDFDNDFNIFAQTSDDVKLMKSLSPMQLKTFIPAFDILKVGTELVIDITDIHNKWDIPESSTDRSYESEPFMSNVIKQLMDDTDYVENTAIDDSEFGLLDKNPKATVWVWTKSLGTDSYLNGRILDITPFIKSIHTHKDKQDGTFSVGLSYVYDKNKVMALSTVYDSVINSVDDLGIRRRNKSQFHDMISKHDIVFIRLNRLKLETEAPESTNLDDIQPSDLVGNIYDMIGLVDSVHDGFGGATDNVSVTLSGADITKLLSEDGASIYQSRFISSGKLSDETEVSGDILRIFGKTRSTLEMQDLPIGKQLQFVIDYMARTKICDALFDANPNARTNKLQLPDGSTTLASEVSGIWKAVHVEVDESVSQYTAYNQNLGNDYNPLLSQLNKVCQEPFVELYTDTYGDQFYIMARRPIFDKTSVLNYSKDINIKTIHEYNIRTDSLDYDKTVYTWYKMDPRYLSAAFDASFKWLLPAKYFQEYVDIFGDKPMQIENPYINYEMAQINSPEASLLGQRQVLASIKDFKYVIESHAYLPFTRRGTITIEGDRTYKRGMWIYNEGTDEMFYLDSVDHDMAWSDEGTQWVTILSVSRGMKRNIIEKYFQIIDMPIPTVVNNNFQSFLESTLLGWNVNLDVFNYFIGRKQANKLDSNIDGII